MAKYVCALIAVSDIARSRAFYEGALGQKVDMDFGPNVSFQGGFAIHERTHFESLLGDGNESRAEAAVVRSSWGELYFEEDDIETIEGSLRTAGVSFVHTIREQPWAQRVFRCMDPDGHVVEVGESLEATARRLVGGGLSAERAAERMGMPVPFIERALANRDRSA